MINTDTLREQLNALGRVVVEGECSSRKPTVFEPAKYPRVNGPRGAQVHVWVTTMSGGTTLLRVKIPMSDLTGPFTEEQVTSTLARLNRGQSFGSLKIWVLKAAKGSVFRGEVQYAAPVTGEEISWLPHVVSRLLTVWQDSTLAVRACATKASVQNEITNHSGRIPGFNASRAAASASTRAVSTGSTRRESIGQILAELDAMVGMTSVKEAVHRLAATQDIARKRQSAGLRTTAPSPHLVFTGNPGTGKTTIARMVGRLYHSMGLLQKNDVVEVGRSDLVGGYVGQTALKTKAVCESALGGVLFIDEAYSLSGATGQDYGREAVETLLTFMENHRDDVAVVVAGYPLEMKTFVNMNPGLSSRFDLTLDFPDYSNDELTQMLEQMFRLHDYQVRDTQLAIWRSIFGRMPRGRGFGNAREVRRLFHEIVAEQAVQLAKQARVSEHDLGSISPWVLRTVSQRYTWPEENATPAPELSLGYL